MGLSNDLISLFVKATKDDNKSNDEVTTYGEISVDDNKKVSVTLDGSDTKIPLSAQQLTVSVVDKDRVRVSIKNHSLCVTGNVTNQSASAISIKDTNDRIDAFDILVADLVSTEELAVERARIDALVVKDADISGRLTVNEADIVDLKAANATISEKLTTAEADISKLNADKLDANTASITYATIERLESAEADIYSLEAAHGDFVNLSTDKFTAIDADIKDLKANQMSVVEADIIRANIADLNAEVGDINTLIFGSATGDTIQTSFSNSVIAQLGDAQIKSAMIESVSASKITAGDIITNNVRVKSKDGSLVISDETMQISDGTRVRVQIGKDASDDYSINIWDADGNLMFSEGGISDSAIKDKIIRDDMVSDTANIAAHKLDIDSLFEEINGSTNTIKSTQVKLDEEGQTLNIAFKSLSDTVTAQGNTLTSQGTQISAVQGQIASKIWQQDINTATNSMSTKYSTLEQNFNGFKTEVSDTYTTKKEFQDLTIGGRNIFGFNKGIVLDQLQNYDYAVDAWDKANKGFTITTVLEAPNDMIIGRLYRLGFNGVEGESYTFSAIVYSNIDNVGINIDICDRGNTSFNIGTTPKKISFSSVPLAYYDSTSSYNGFVDIYVNGDPIPAGTTLYFQYVKIERGNVATDWTPAPEDLATSDEMKFATTRISQTENDITSVANRTKTVEDKFALYSTTEQMNSSITQKADSITSKVEAVRETVANLQVGGRNLLMGTGTSLNIPETEDFVSKDKTIMYNLHPDIVADPKAFVLSVKNSYLAFSFDVNVSAIYKNPSLSLNRVGGYFVINFTHNTTGAKVPWYGTHSAGVSASGNSFGYSNSLVNAGDETTSFIGHYAGYCDMSVNGSTILKSFYENPDDYTVTVGACCIEIRGYTTGGYIKNVKLEVGNKPTAWSPAPEDVSGEIDSVESRVTTVEQTANGLTIRMSAAETNVTNASKTATNYINASTSGLVVGDMTTSTLGKNVLIDSDSVDIRNGTTTLASFGADTIYLGKNSEKAVINLCNGSATMTSVDDTDFRIYTDKRLVMSAYSSALIHCFRDLTHQASISVQSANPDNTYMWSGISCSIYQDEVENTFDMSNNTTQFKITNGTKEAIVDLNETRLRIQANNTQINCTNGLYVGYDGDYGAKITLGYDFLQDKSIRWFWSDNALHDGISNNNGQATYLGPGDIDETTTTYVRGKYVRLYGHTGGGVYLGTSGTTAVTSDRNLKTDILDLDDKYMDFFDRLRPITYKYTEGHRDHVGFVAQEVEEALIASGLTTEEFAGIIIENDVTLNPNYDSSMSDEEKQANEMHYDTLYSLRYEEFISLLVKKVQSLQEQINQLRTAV